MHVVSHEEVQLTLEEGSTPRVLVCNTHPFKLLSHVPPIKETNMKNSRSVMSHFTDGFKESYKESFVKSQKFTVFKQTSHFKWNQLNLSLRQLPVAVWTVHQDILG